MNSPALPKLALIAGPTASGKSALALALAERTGGTIINADSAQVYRELRIVTARPTAEEEARAPHLLYGYRAGAEACSAAAWASDARQAISGTLASGGLPILTGGTGLYIRTLLDGIAPVPDIDPDVRSCVRALSAGEAHAALGHEDPEGAARIRPSDTTRAARALEVIRSTGRTLSAWQLERRGGIGDSVELVPLILLPPREWLQARCDVRFKEIASEEGLEEVSSLLDLGLGHDLPVMRAIGVREMLSLLRGEVTREVAIEAGQAATRKYAKRQFTWFSRQPPSTWPRHRAAFDCGEMRNVLAALDARLSG